VRLSAWQLLTLAILYGEQNPDSVSAVEKIRIYRPMATLRFITNYWGEWERRKGFMQSLLGMLTSVTTDEFAGSLQATDPRDIVYGMLGLASTEESANVVADYGLPTHMVFTLTARNLIFYWNSLNILCTCNGIRSDSPAMELLPSWVPKWAQKADLTYHADELPVREETHMADAQPHRR
jgi:hypothetical protein